MANDRIRHKEEHSGKNILKERKNHADGTKSI